MSNYGFNHEGYTFTSNGDTPIVSTQADTDAHNRKTEQAEIAWLKTGPDKVLLYVKQTDTTEETYQDALSKGWTPETTERKNWASHRWDIQTWMGTRVSEGRAYVGRSVNVGGIAGYHARKRSVDCRIFSVRYVGWYYETAGDYCRLRKAKRQ
jgi:hypothetical protein